jgi:hypothetical protein
MVRSIGAARGAVVVAAGAENVRPPRLPELPMERASALASVRDSAATTASAASSQRWVRIMVFPQQVESGFQTPDSCLTLYRYPKGCREGALHSAAGSEFIGHYEA